MCHQLLLKIQGSLNEDDLEKCLKRQFCIMVHVWIRADFKKINIEVSGNLEFQ